VEPEDVGLPAEAWPEPLALDLVVDRSGEQLTIAGRGRTVVEDDCARCLTHVRLPLEFELALHADRAGSGGRDEQALAEDDLVMFHDGRPLELGDEVREAALLAR